MREGVFLVPSPSEMERLRAEYEGAQPFPHIVLEDFLDPEMLEQGLAEFPPIDSEAWIHYLHVNERKYGRTDRATFGPVLGSLFDELNSPRFVEFLTRLTGIPGLFADPSLEGGGLHQSKPGGYLNIHADFTVHPHNRDWQRRINVLVYLNKEWREAYGGELELWDRGMKRCVKKVLPVFNRAVIFSTDPDSFHGHPDPLRCPSGQTRKSLALYYFTKGDNRLFVRSTEYRARPQDSSKRLWIYLDKMALRGYDLLKRKFGVKDDFASKLLRKLDRLRARVFKKKDSGGS